MSGNKNGFTLLEVLLAIALLVTISYGIVAGSAFLFKAETATGTMSDESKLIQSVIENISANPGLYQKNFSSQAAVSLETILVPDQLPLAFGPDYFGPRSGCDTPAKCTGYMGYVLVPSNGARGLFEVTLRVAKPQRNSDGSLMNPPSYTSRDYLFITHSN